MYTASFCKLYEPVQLFCGQWKYLPIRPQESDVGSILLLPPSPSPLPPSLSPSLYKVNYLLVVLLFACYERFSAVRIEL